MQASTPLEDQLLALARRLDAVERRLAELESGHPYEGPPSEARPVPEPIEPAVRPAFDARSWTTALGRSFIVLGGAFLLRALTDAAVWPPAAGVLLGLIYALFWIVTSDRAAAAGDRVRALFDGGTALLIGYPLITEATTRFGLLDRDTAALALTTFSAVALVAAWRSNLRTLAWLGTVGGMVTGLVLMVRVGVVVPYSLYFTALGAGTLWLSYLRLWRALRWPTGLLAVAGVAGVTSRAVSEPPADPAALAWLAQGALLAVYFASIAIRTLVRGRQVLVFEVVQTALILAVSIGGAFAVSRSAGAGNLVLGTALVGLGVAAYLVSFPFLPRESRGGINFYFYSTLALLLVLIGLQTALAGTPRALALTVLGVALAAVWSRSGRISLGGHTAAALVAASLASGLMALAQGAFVGERPVVSALSLTVLVAAFGTAATTVARSDGTRPQLRDLPALIIALLAGTGAAGALVVLFATIVGQVGVGAVDAGGLASIRTAVLSFGALGCALVDRPGRFSAMGKLAYPILVVTGVKLALLDLRYSTPSTSFFALAVYGAALLMVARLRRGSSEGERA